MNRVSRSLAAESPRRRCLGSVEPSRPSFWRAATLVSVLGSVAAFLACTSQPDWTSFTVESVEGSLDVLGAAESTYRVALDDVGRAGAAVRALDFLDAQPCVDSAGLCSDSSIWVVFRNGLPGSVFVSVEDTARATRWRECHADPRDLARAAGGTVCGNAHFFAPFRWEYDDVTPRVVELVQARCPLLFPWSFYDDAVTVDAIAGTVPALFYWQGHGHMTGYYGGQPEFCALLTGENYSSLQMAELVVARYCSTYHMVGPEPCLKVVSYCGRHFLEITPAFVSQFVHFDTTLGHLKGRMAYVDACYSATPVNGSMLRAAFFDAGASSYWGWDDRVYVRPSCEVTMSVFQMLADTFTCGEAIKALPSRSCPGTLQFSGDSSQMLRHVLEALFNGQHLDCSSAGCTRSWWPSGEPLTSIEGFGVSLGLLVGFAGHWPGVYTEAETTAGFFCSGEAVGGYYSSDPDGTSGIVSVERFDADVASGTFSAVLRGDGGNVLTISDGFFKISGIGTSPLAEAHSTSWGLIGDASRFRKCVKMSGLAGSFLGPSRPLTAPTAADIR